MWICGSCGEPLEDQWSICRACGGRQPFRQDGRDGSYEEEPSDPVPVTESPSHQMPLELASRMEPRVASDLAVWVWVLAVFAFVPLAGIPVAMALAVCSVLLIRRHGGLAWDRRIGLAGVIVSLAALAVPALWLLMVVLRYPFEVPQFLEVKMAEQRSWTVTAAQLGVLVVSIMLHECGHAVSAHWSGDATASRLGRISLNPVVHVDLFGSVILPAILVMSNSGFLLGWAKPVPINPNQFRHRRRGLLGVTVAGISLNLMLAMASVAGLLAVGSLLRILYPEASSQGFAMIFDEATFTGLPGGEFWEFAVTALKMGLVVNLVLFTFNVLPIPPLDGFGILESLAPQSLQLVLARFRSLGWLVLLGLIISGLLSLVMLPAILLAVALNLLAGAATGWP